MFEKTVEDFVTALWIFKISVFGPMKIQLNRYSKNCIKAKNIFKKCKFVIFGLLLEK